MKLPPTHIAKQLLSVLSCFFGSDAGLKKIPVCEWNRSNGPADYSASPPSTTVSTVPNRACACSSRGPVRLS